MLRRFTYTAFFKALKQQFSQTEPRTSFVEPPNVDNSDVFLEDLLPGSLDTGFKSFNNDADGN